LWITLSSVNVVILGYFFQFLSLQSDLATPFVLPPKRILATTFIPSAWLDDSLISERKAGLSAYLRAVLQSDSFQADPRVNRFLTLTDSVHGSDGFHPEDALPSTLTRTAAAAIASELSTAAVPIAAAYYPDWSMYTLPPEKIDYSQFDILFFGSYS
jgi:chitinase